VNTKKTISQNEQTNKNDDFFFCFFVEGWGTFKIEKLEVFRIKKSIILKDL
jgi:hypothetical protein